MVRRSIHVTRTVSDKWRVDFYGQHIGTFDTSKEAHAALREYLNSLANPNETNRRNPDTTTKG
jgi:hypothetical protein